MSGSGHLLCASDITALCTDGRVAPRILPSTGSTNEDLCRAAQEGAPEGTVIVALSQTRGRGRLGRSFVSPQGGLYFSLLLRPDAKDFSPTLLTPAASVAVAQTLEQIGAGACGIKWVNDIYLRGRKVCGILTQTAWQAQASQPDYCVVGIGINLTTPASAFPAELDSVAGSVFPRGTNSDLRAEVIAGVCQRLLSLYDGLKKSTGAPPFYEEYCKRCFIPGQHITVFAPGKAPRPALALEIEPDFSLRVRFEDNGTTVSLSCGEVSVRQSPLPAFHRGNGEDDADSQQ